MMHGHEKSDLARVAEKPANKAEQPTAEASTGASAAEPVERRAGTKGNAGQQSTCRAQNRISVSQALERIRQFARSEEHTSELQSRQYLVCRLLLEKKKMAATSARLAGTGGSCR